MKHTLQELKDFSNKYIDNYGLCLKKGKCSEGCPFYNEKEICIPQKKPKCLPRYIRLVGFIKKFPSIVLEGDK